MAPPPRASPDTATAACRPEGPSGVKSLTPTLSDYPPGAQLPNRRAARCRPGGCARFDIPGATMRHRTIHQADHATAAGEARLDPEQLQRRAELIAGGRDRFPEDLPRPERDRLLLLV